MGWTGIKNGQSLALASEHFDVFVTVDRSLCFRQNLNALSLALIVLLAKTNRLADLKPLVPRLLSALDAALPARCIPSTDEVFAVARTVYIARAAQLKDTMASLYDFSAKRLDGTQESLGRYRGDVLLIVNTASRCGFTPQYAGLEALQRAFALRRFNVLGFPCNQFGNQEPGDASAIDAFCQRSYGISFPMFAKVDVNGNGAHPLFRFLKVEQPGFLWLKGIKWNFTKFLVDRDGRPCGRYGPTTTPEAIGRKIEALL